MQRTCMYVNTELKALRQYQTLDRKFVNSLLFLAGRETSPMIVLSYH